MKENETVMSIQTMKNAVEIRAPFSGIIKNHFFKIGDNVNCNTELFEIEQNDTVVNSKQQVNKKSVSDNNTKEKQKNESDKKNLLLLILQIISIIIFLNQKLTVQSLLNPQITIILHLKIYFLIAVLKEWL